MDNQAPDINKCSTSSEEVLAKFAYIEGLLGGDKICEYKIAVKAWFHISSCQRCQKHIPKNILDIYAISKRLDTKLNRLWKMPLYVLGKHRLNNGEESRYANLYKKENGFERYEYYSNLLTNNELQEVRQEIEKNEVFQFWENVIENNWVLEDKLIKIKETTKSIIYKEFVKELTFSKKVYGLAAGNSERIPRTINMINIQGSIEFNRDSTNGNLEIYPLIEDLKVFSSIKIKIVYSNKKYEEIKGKEMLLDGPFIVSSHKVNEIEKLEVYCDEKNNL